MSPPSPAAPVEVPRTAVRPLVGVVLAGRVLPAPWELNVFDFDGTVFRSPVLDTVRA